MKCAFSLATFPPSQDPRRSVTRARRLYVSRLANFRLSDRPQMGGSVQGCTLPPVSQGPFSPSMATGTLGHPWPADGSSGTIVSSGDYRRRRVLQNNTIAEG